MTSPNEEMLFCARCGHRARCDLGAFHELHASEPCASFEPVPLSALQEVMADGSTAMLCPVKGCRWRQTDASKPDRVRVQLFDAHMEWHRMNGLPSPEPLRVPLDDPELSEESREVIRRYLRKQLERLDA